MVKSLDYKVVVDTREQKPYWKESDSVVRKKLDVGDYSIEGYEDQICLERKSLGDLFGTLGKGHARFKRELERAQELEYFAIVIDGTLLQCINKDFPGSKHSRMSGSTIFKILCTLHIKYGVNFFFTQGRNASKRLIKGLFEAYLTQKTKAI